MRLEASHLGQRLTPDGHSSPVIAGFVVAIFPGSSLVLLARIAGIMLVLIGVAELVTAFMAAEPRERAPARAARRHPPRPDGIRRIGPRSSPVECPVLGVENWALDHGCLSPST